MHGDGIVLGWHAGRLIESPVEDNVLLFGVQRSGKTSSVVVPTLLGLLAGIFFRGQLDAALFRRLIVVLLVLSVANLIWRSFIAN